MDPAVLAGARTGSSSLRAGDIQRAAEEFASTFQRIEDEVGKVVVGLPNHIKLCTASIFIGGHVLFEGQPGLAKTLLAKSLAEAFNIEFKRIQFTPDLMPGDITGSMVLNSKREFELRKGPVFSNLVLGDEINRAGPKTQAALLEAMGEQAVTIDTETHPLPKPFIVLATQNPLESDGTYPLPDAQLDRFALKLRVAAPTIAQRMEISRRTTGTDIPTIKPVFDSADACSKILEMRELIRSVVISPEIEETVMRIVTSLTPNHPEGANIPVVNQSLRYGPSPRADQAIILFAKAHALLNGRFAVAEEDLKPAMIPILRHRIGIKVEALFDVNPDQVIREVMSHFLND